ncbi:MAG TPA: heme o synthase [Candidatus Acidoferrales bacterium]|nr:heme o synthase [Candidatus Acidoferrales bacterium]
MAVESIPVALDAAVLRRSCSQSSRWSDYWMLTKPEINFLIAITTGAAFCVGSPAAIAHFPWVLLFHTLLGTVIVASGAAILNQVIERRFDAQMRRTARRPLASGRINSSHALWFGISLSLLGIVYLALSVNFLASLLAALTLFSYLFLYTPLKRRTPLCTLIGAFPGAVPPLIGWAAARGRLEPGAWALYAIVFFWQFPHFMAIAWMYREDYARAGYLVLPAGGIKERFVIWQSFVVSLVLIPLGLFSWATGEFVSSYCIGILVLGSFFSVFAARFAFCRSNATARQLLFASIVYLPATFVLMMLSKK